MAASAEHLQCFSFNIFGCRLVGLLPHQQQPHGGHNGPMLTPEEANIAKRKRDSSIRQALIVLYTIGGLLGGLAIAASVLGAQELRRPVRACRYPHYSPSPEEEEHCWPLLPSMQAPLETSDVILLANALATILMGGFAIVCVMDNKLHWLKWISVGFVSTMLMQGAVTVVIVVSYEATSNFDRPYVPHTMLNQIERAFLSAMLDYQTDPVATNRWDYLQERGCCCGMDEWKDWQERARKDVPESCYCQCSHYSFGDCEEWRCRMRRPMIDIGMCGNKAFPMNNGTVTDVGCMDPILRNVGLHTTRIMQLAYVVFFGLISLQFVAALAPVIQVCSLSRGTLPMSGQPCCKENCHHDDATGNKYRELLEDSVTSDIDQLKHKDGFEA